MKKAVIGFLVGCALTGAAAIAAFAFRHELVAAEKSAQEKLARALNAVKNKKQNEE